MTNSIGENPGPAMGAPAGVEMFAQLQATTRVLLEMQASQNRLFERYLESQERLLYHCGQASGFAGLTYVPAAPALSAPAVVETPVIAAPTPVAYVPPPAVPTPVVRQPVAMPAPAAVPTPRVVAAAPAAPPAPPAVPVAAASAPAPAAVAPAPAPAAPVAAAPAAPAPTAANTSGPMPPPVDVFRQDLLQIVSERTGYPTDMLDEELPLEAGLGIDSIKTVEIFSNLKEYHVFFRDENQDEEEALTEFTNLKTLRDIINSYERRRDAILASGAGVNGSGHAGTNGSTGSGVERFSVTAVEAPLEGNGSKKNFLSATSS